MLKQAYLIERENENNYDIVRTTINDHNVHIYYQKDDGVKYNYEPKKILELPYKLFAKSSFMFKNTKNTCIYFSDSDRYTFDTKEELFGMVDSFNFLFKKNSIFCYTTLYNFNYFKRMLIDNKDNYDFLLRRLSNDSNFKTFYDFILENFQSLNLREDMIYNFSIYFIYLIFYKKDRDVLIQPKG